MQTLVNLDRHLVSLLLEVHGDHSQSFLPTTGVVGSSIYAVYASYDEGLSWFYLTFSLFSLGLVREEYSPISHGSFVDMVNFVSCEKCLS